MKVSFLIASKVTDCVTTLVGRKPPVLPEFGNQAAGKRDTAVPRNPGGKAPLQSRPRRVCLFVADGNLSMGDGSVLDRARMDPERKSVGRILDRFVWFAAVKAR